LIRTARAWKTAKKKERKREKGEEKLKNNKLPEEEPFDFSNLTQLIKRFRDLRNEIQSLPDNKQITMEKFLGWRGSIIPFLNGKYVQEDILFNLGMVNALLHTSKPETRRVIKYSILNLLDREFLDFMTEVKRNRNNEVRNHEIP